MRWRVLTALLIIGLILTGGIYCRSRIEQTCEQMDELLLQQKELPDPDVLNEALLLWEEQLPLLSTLLHHQRLDEVGQSLARSTGALQAGDFGQYIAQIDSILYMLSDIREYDHINLKTLF